LDKHDLVKKLGRDVVENYDVLNHDPAMVTYLGTTSRGTPLEVNSRVVEADFRISTGFIEPHFFAGFSGGSKSIMPGVSSARTIRSNHSYRMLENPRAGAGILKGNPVHEDIVECGKMARLDFIVNVLLNKDGDITCVVSGDPVLAHETGCRLEREATRVTVAQPVDITITTNGGAPLDLDFYQTCKGIDTASRITRDGGIIIVASACDTGVGPQEFLASHSSSASPGEVLQKISCSETSGVCWQNQILARAQLNHEIFLYSCLEDAVARQMKVIPIHSLQEGLDAAFKALGPGAKIAVIPEGPLVLPVVKNKKG
jgi:nickel-dependent lactate racemase